jgi:CDP-diacylglycerol--glycerol-3-phosphate 3-phosphatidyltransferase
MKDFIKNNVANLVSMGRVILCFIAIALLFNMVNWSYIIAFILTILVISMDALDGYLARKLNQTSTLGGVLDILSDRIVENVYWISFLALNWIPLWVPLVVVTRGIITDGLRGLGLKKGFTPFGEKTMMQNKIFKFIVASNFTRFAYAATKALAFSLLIAVNYPDYFDLKRQLYPISYFIVYLAVFFCIIRGIPVLIESKKFFTNKNV